MAFFFFLLKIIYSFSVCFPWVIEKRWEFRVSLRTSLSGRRVPGDASGLQGGEESFLEVVSLQSHAGSNPQEKGCMSGTGDP